MQELRKKMQSHARSDLAAMTRTGRDALARIAEDSAITSGELARMIVGGRTGSLEKELIGRMVKTVSDDLYDRYLDQQSLPLDDEPPAKGKDK